MTSVEQGPHSKSKFLLFFKNRQQFRKGAAGAIYNLFSRVCAGVIAGYITTQMVVPKEPVPVELTPEQVGAITGAVAN